MFRSTRAAIRIDRHQVDGDSSPTASAFSCLNEGQDKQKRARKTRPVFDSKSCADDYWRTASCVVAL